MTLMVERQKHESRVNTCWTFDVVRVLFSVHSSNILS